MTNTPDLNITLVSQAQSQKEVTINAAIQLLEMLQNNGVKSKALTAPPGSPAEGDLYVVATSPTGAWAGQAGKFAYYINGSWSFTSPRTGCPIWDVSLSKLQVYTGSSFTTVGADSSPSFTIVGVNTTADATNKLAVASSAILFNNIGNDCKTYINKNAAGDGGSIIFETGWSGRAELGCIGSDDFQLKVSPDGSSFTQAWVIDKTTGVTAFKQTSIFEKGVQIEEGSNLYAGTAVLVGGVVVVSNTLVASNSRIHLTTQAPGGVVGSPYISARTSSTSFTISSTSVADTSTVYWELRPAG